MRRPSPTRRCTVSSTRCPRERPPGTAPSCGSMGASSRPGRRSRSSPRPSPTCQASGRRESPSSRSRPRHPRIYFDPVGPCSPRGAPARRCACSASTTPPTASSSCRGRRTRQAASGSPSPSRGRPASVPATSWSLRSPGCRSRRTRRCASRACTPWSPTAARRPRLRDNGSGVTSRPRAIHRPHHPHAAGHLAVADLATTAGAADDIDDEVLWSAVAPLDSQRPRLSDVDATAEGVADLRLKLVADVDNGAIPPALRPGVAERGSSTSPAGPTSSPTPPAADRRDDRGGHRPRPGARRRGGRVVQRAPTPRGAPPGGYGRRRPVSAGLLHAVEVLPAALVGGVVGWLVARVLVDTAVGATPLPVHPRRLGRVVRRRGAPRPRPHGGRRRRRDPGGGAAPEGRDGAHVPWVLVLVVLAVAARPDCSPGRRRADPDRSARPARSPARRRRGRRRRLARSSSP